MKYTCLDYDMQQIVFYLMNPVSDVIISPGTTKSFLPLLEVDKDT